MTNVESFDPRRLPSDWSEGEAALLCGIDDATATPVHIAYRLGAEWAQGVHAVLDDLETLTRSRPAAALPLIEHTLTRLDRADIDDSDGWMMGFCERLTAMHAVASADLAPTDVAARVARLQSLELRPFDGLAGRG